MSASTVTTKSSLDGKTIVVIGGGGRIGWKAVLHIIEQGAHVIACDFQFGDMVNEAIDNNPNIDESLKLHHADVCSAEEVSQFFRGLPAIDGLVNCSYPRGRNYGRDFLEVDLDDFNHTLSLHLGSCLLVTQECVRHFNQHQKWFSLVNFSSIYGVIAPRFDVYSGTMMTTPVEYSLMKAAIQHLNKYVSSYLRDSRFRINTIAPGGILDDQPKSFLDNYGGYSRGVGMLASEDICGTIAFLLSDESRFLTGQNLIVDDGYHL